MALVAKMRQVWFAAKERVFFRRYGERSERFSAIYTKRMWGNPESASGFGSTLQATHQARDGLVTLLRDFDIASILDSPCGDFNWMKNLPFNGTYLGLDIVPDLIASNLAAYGSASRNFMVGDIVTDTLPEAELVMCRECLNHLPLADGRRAVEHLAAAARKLLVITHYPHTPVNTDQPASFRYRSLNLTLAPFGLRMPDRVIDESQSEIGKVLAVWDLARGTPFALS